MNYLKEMLCRGHTINNPRLRRHGRELQGKPVLVNVAKCPPLTAEEEKQLSKAFGELLEKVFD